MGLCLRSPLLLAKPKSKVGPQTRMTFTKTHSGSLKFLLAVSILEVTCTSWLKTEETLQSENQKVVLSFCKTAEGCQRNNRATVN